MFKFIKSLFKPKCEHSYTKWQVTSRLVNSAGWKKISQERQCKTCGYTQIKTDTTY